MSNASVSEQILALLSSRERAAEVVGDLLEQGLTGGVFRAAILRVALRLLLRWVAGLWSALACSISVVALYCLYVIPKWKLPQHETWVVWSVRGGGASFCLATVVGLAALRYGIRDRLTRMSVLVWLSITASACLAWLPHAAYGIVPILVLGSVIVWWRLSTRRLLVGVLAPTATFAACAGLFYLFSRLTLIPGTAKAGVANLSFAAFSFFASLLVESAVMGRLRPGLLDRA